MQPNLIYGDNSLLIEWAGDNERFGILLEDNLEESGWYLATTGETMESGPLSITVIAAIVNYALVKGALQ